MDGMKILLALSGMAAMGLLASCTERPSSWNNPSERLSFACAPDEGLGLMRGSNKKPLVIPTLQNWDGGNGLLTLTPRSRILLDPTHTQSLKETALLFQNQLREVSGLSLPIVPHAPSITTGDIALSLTPCGDMAETLGSEGYSVYAQNTISLRANTPTGLFYATQTLLQTLALDTSIQAPGTHVVRGFSTDTPRYRDRVIMFDVGRKFADTTFLKNYIKFMGWYKLNVLHLHLNDQAKDESGTWALRAFRLKSDKPEFAALEPDDGLFYTREDWDELETVAATYGVRIVPEIDSPGHAGAFVLANPSIGHPADKLGGTLDPTNPAALDYIKAVFDEFLPWFRAPSVHIGGDEASLDAAEIPLKSQIAYLNALGQHLINQGKTVEIWGDANYLPNLDKRFIIQRWISWGSEGKLNWKKEGHDWIESHGDWYTVPFSPGSTYVDGIKGEVLYEKWPQDTNPYAPIGGQLAVWNDNARLRSYTWAGLVHDMLKDAIPAAGQVFWRGQEKDADGTVIPYATLQQSIHVLQYGPDVSLFSSTPITGRLSVAPVIKK